MGLGKTCQMLALCMKRPKTDDSLGGVLVVSPVSVCVEWEMEIKKHLNLDNIK